ncbi:MAG: archaellin/type IV pilin N-terminal domain-containing protein [Candidatus Heimdallarchaeota archaeon]
MLTNKIKSLWARRKAVSPVIATILLIALTVTAAAIVYFVVVPLLKGDGELVVMDYDLENKNATPFADTFTVSINNIGTAAVTISQVVVTKNGVEVNWTLSSESYLLTQGSSTNVKCSAADAVHEFGYGELAVFTFAYEGDNSIVIEVKVPARFSHFVLQYENDFETATDLSEWTHYPMATHGGGTHTIADWRITEQGGNHFAECTNNDCQFVILEDPLRDFYDVNITYDLRTGDDDGNGIIYRFDDSGTYPNFYCVWFTRNHPSAANPSHDGGHDYFDWATPGDIVLVNKITVHYVEGDADGYNWYKLAEADWTRSNNVWYSWRIVADGSNGALFIDNSETATLSWVDSQLSHGFIGFVSFANDDSDFDNIYVWQTVTVAS